MIRIGTLIDVEKSISHAIEETGRIKDAGYDSAWANQIFGQDALTLLAVVGNHVPDIELGTAVVPVYPRHPQMLAQQSLTVQSATDGRLCLGIGLSHQMVVEGLWGFSYDRPGRYMREYLEALMPMLRGDVAMVDGEVIKSITVGPLDIPDVAAPQVLVAALAPYMLKLTGAMTDGTITWMTGISTVESHIAPLITEAAAEAGKPTPRIVVSLPVCVTDDVARAKDDIDAAFSIYPTLPSYAAMLEKEGAARPADIALVGSREQISEEIARLEAAGGTELVAAISGNAAERADTFEFLGSLTSR
jgi:F420-dependent oxidoreductase-like protein